MSQEREVDEIAQSARALVREVRDYPEPGVVFKDITPVLADGEIFPAVVRWMAQPFAGRVDMVAGIEARGFILGAPVAHSLGVGFVPIRKLGKLPGITVAEAYVLEYGEATLEMHADALQSGQRVLIVDDVIATGGTVRATIELVRKAGGHVVAVTALLSIEALGGASRLADCELHVLFEA
jgi:adenine phosphoribosyltransferase